MRFLVTGCSGMVGAHLARYLWSGNHEVHALVRPRSQSRVLTAEEWARVVKHPGDLADEGSLHVAVVAAEPDRIVHLAAQSHVPASWSAPIVTLATNVIGTAHLLEAIRRQAPGARVLVAGSSEQYGLVEPGECPIRESQPVRPQSSYGVAKVAADLLGYQYHRSYGLHVVRARAFNHFGPGRPAAFAEGAFASQIAQIERGAEPILRHGNLEAVRDYTDARDTVRAYVALLTDGVPGEAYNIASGRGRAMSEVLAALLSLSPAGGKIRCEPDPARMRPSDVPLLVGDATRLHGATGWKPEIPFEQTLRDLLDWHRAEAGE